jgi:hypothetical protein
MILNTLSQEIRAPRILASGLRAALPRLSVDPDHVVAAVCDLDAPWPHVPACHHGNWPLIIRDVRENPWRSAKEESIA